LASQWASEDASVQATARMILDFSDNNVSFAWTCVAADTDPGGANNYVIRVYNGSVWASAEPGAGFGGPVVFIYATDQYLFCAMNTVENFWRWDGAAVGSTWIQPGVGFQAKTFAYYNDTLYRSLGNEFFTSDDDGVTWSAATGVGWDSTDIEDMYHAAGFLVICKPEGLWLYDGTNLERMIFSEQNKNTSNFVGGTEHLGEVFIPWNNTLRKALINNIRSYTFTDITPRMKGNTNKVDYGHGFPKRVFGAPGNRIYVALDDGQSDQSEVLLYNDIGFHQVWTSTSVLYASGYSALNGWVLINDGSTRRKRLRTLSDAEFPDYAASGVFTTPQFDGGFPDTLKAWRDITLETRSADANNTIKIEYSADEGAFVTVGTIVSSSPTKQTLVLAGLDGVVSAKKIQFRFTLTRNAGDVTETPVIELPIVVRVLVTPEAQHVFTDAVALNLNAPLRNDHGRISDLYTMDDMIAFIDELEDTPEVIIRTDRYGRRSRIKNTDFQRQDPPQIPADYRLEYPTVGLTFVEAFSGLQRTIVEDLSMTETVSLTLIDLASAIYGTDRYGLSVYGS
jgi:hypothetical protein